MSCRAWVHRSNELKCGRIFDLRACPADVDSARFQRLPEGFEGGAGELRHLVEKQDAAVRKRDLARSGVAAAAGQRRNRCGVMRSAKWPVYAIARWRLGCE